MGSQLHHVQYLTGPVTESEVMGHCTKKTNNEALHLAYLV